MDSYFRSGIQSTKSLIPAASNHSNDTLLILSKRPVSSTLQAYLNNLTHLAFDAAESVHCSSITAGQSSESDEFGDVVVWVDTRDDLTASGIVDMLGLKIEQGTRLEVEATPLSIFPSSEQGAVMELTTTLSQLASPISFTIRGEPTNTVIRGFFGKTTTKNEEVGWVGLVGVGVWSDD